MKEEVINAKEILFANKKGEKLSLAEIIDTRLIKSVTLNYLSKKRIEAKEETQDEMLVEIYSHNLDLTLEVNLNLEVVVIKISSESEFNKVIDDSYDENSIKKTIGHCLVTPYHITVPLEALIKIDFDE